jgi:hypothetical protein
MAPRHQPSRKDDDNLLVAELGRLFATLDPVPESVQIAARVAIEWRTLDAELAALVHDSTIDEPALGLRGDGGPRALTFEAPDLTIEIETEQEQDGAGDTMRLVGQLVPPQAAQIAVRNGDDLVTTSADERGRFSAPGLSAGSLRLRCRLNDDRLVETDWLTI